MANRKITEFVSLTQPAGDDVFPIVDVSEALDVDKNKKITVAEIFKSIPSGSAAAPGIAFEGNDSVGIYRPGTDQLAISTGGTGRLFIDASGNVGVGVSPTAKLTVQGDGSFKVASGNVGVGLISGSVEYSSYINASDSSYRLYSSLGGDRLVIGSTGNVGIGTTSPGAPLDVNGAIYSRSTGVYTDTITSYTGSSISVNAGSSNINFIVNASERARIDSSGRLGLGTSSPSSYDFNGPVVLAAANTAGSSTISVISDAASLGQLAFADGTTGTTRYRGLLEYNHSTDAFQIRTAGAPAVTIDSSQRVGIGTTSPGAPLAFGKAVYAAPSSEDFYRVKFEDVGGIANDVGLGQAGSGTLGLNCAATGNVIFYKGGTETARIDSSGRLGLGTSSPGYLLEASSGATDATALFNSTAATGSHIRFGRSGTVDGYLGCATGFLTSGTSAGDVGIRSQGAFVVGTGGNNNRLFIASDGKVGLGTSSASSKLHIYDASSVGVKIESGGANYTELNLANTSASYTIGIRPDVSNALVIRDANATANRVAITSAGNVGIGTTSPSQLLDVAGDITFGSSNKFISAANTLYGAGTNGVYLRSAISSETNPSYSSASDTNTGFFLPGSDVIGFTTGGSERARIDSSGRLLVGTSTARTNFFNTASTFAPLLQIESATDANRFQSLIYNSSSAEATHFCFGKTRGTTVGSNTVVASGDDLGAVSFLGSDGSEFVEAARIQTQVDGTPGSNDMPGRLVFSTTADGAASPTERMRITSAGNVGIGTASHPYSAANRGLLTINGTSSSVLGLSVGDAAAGYLFANGSSLTLGAPTSVPITFDINGERARIDSSGRLGLGTSSPAVKLDLANIHGINNTITRPFALRNYGQISATGYGVGMSFFYPNGTTSDLGFEAAAIDSSYTSGGNYGNLIFSTNNNTGVAERMRITSAGNVGIGTTGPSNNLEVAFSASNSSSGITITNNQWYGYGARLQFRNLLTSAGTVGETASIYGEGDGSNAGRLVFYTTAGGTASERARIDSSGRLGLGTSSPSELFHLSTTSVSDATLIRLDGGAGLRQRFFPSSGTGKYNWQIAVQTNVDNGFEITPSTASGGSTFSTPAVVVKNDGKVGIGTTSPSGTLTVQSAVSGATSYLNEQVSIFNSQTGSAGNQATIGFHLNNANWGPATTYARVSAVLENGTTGATALAFGTAADGSLLTPNERARIDSSGRLLVGTSSSSANTRLVVQGNTAGGTYQAGVIDARINGANPPANYTIGEINFRDNADARGALIKSETDGDWASNDYPGRLVFSTTSDGASSPTERLRITSGGAVAIGTTSPETSYMLTVAGDAPGGGAGGIAAKADGVGDANFFSSSTLIGYHFYGLGASSKVFYVENDGDVRNTNNSYGAVSDLKLKQDLDDASSQWEDIKAVRVRKFRFKSNPDSNLHIGVIAQELELVSPGLVDETIDRDAEGEDLGTVTKSVKYSVLYMKAVKALQEAMERIEALEAKVAALEGN